MTAFKQQLEKEKAEKVAKEVKQRRITLKVWIILTTR